MASVDVVVVAYNSGEHLRACAGSVLASPLANLIVVDNASRDHCLSTIADLDVTTIAQPFNGGFAHGCNVGIRAGSAPWVLFLNPDARIDPSSLSRLVEALEQDDTVGAVGPRIVHEDGAPALTQRLFPRTVTVLAQALFLHRLFPAATWVDDVVRDPRAYAEPRAVEWLSGACLLVRRTALERVGGFDEGFFHYCEDVDLCRMLHRAGFGVRYEPRATAVHVGAHSAPLSALQARLAASKIRYARKHRSAAGRLSERAALALYALTHSAFASGGNPARKGHREALAAAVRGGLPASSPWQAPRRHGRADSSAIPFPQHVPSGRGDAAA